MNAENQNYFQKYSFAYRTDLGKVRSNNEDYYDFFHSEFGDVFIVCDGMGGHSGGEIASQLATNAIKNRILNNPRKLSHTSDIISEAIDIANKVIIDKSNENPTLKGMGTTVVILILKDNQAFFGHVGDSRLYLLRGNIFTSLTRDHSFVQHLVDKGLITPKEAETHPRRNEITKALGISENLIPDINSIKVHKGDRFLLCTDGLNSMLSDEEIYEILSQNDVESAADILVERANIYGGKDNITLEIIEINEGEDLTEEATISEIKPESEHKREEEKIKFIYQEEKESTDNEPEVERKKFSFVKLLYFILPAVFVIIILVLVYLLMKEKKEGVKETVDTTKITKHIEGKHLQLNKDSIMLEILRDLYAGKRNSQLYNADNIEYIGKNSKEKMTESDFIKNKETYNIEFNNIEGNVNSRGDTLNCEYKVLFGKDKYAIYEIIVNIKQKPYKIELIKFIRELKKDSDIKQPQQKKEEVKKESKKLKKDESNKKKDDANKENKNEKKVKEYRKEVKKDSIKENNEQNNK